mmetsp:Transcript_127579/g.367044  ORF Transcript_127579/g.367044 Transcript_127579/m.367044 type:complete len:266 (-) Transcript_127579:1604-2401(-)
MWAVPRLLQAPEIQQDFFHFNSAQCLADHDGAPACATRKQLPNLLWPRHSTDAQQGTVAGHVEKALGRTAMRSNRRTKCGCPGGDRRGAARDLGVFEDVDEIMDVPLTENHPLTSRERSEPQTAPRRFGIVARDVEPIRTQNVQVRLCNGLLRRRQLQRVRCHKRLPIYFGLPVEALETDLLVRRMLVDNKNLQTSVLAAARALHWQRRYDEAEVELPDDPHLRKATLAEAETIWSNILLILAELYDLLDGCATKLVFLQRRERE